MQFPVEQFPVETVREVARLLESADLSEISIENGAQQARLTLKRAAHLVVSMPFEEGAETESSLETAALEGGAETSESVLPSTQTVNAPCVGLFRVGKGIEVGTAVKAKQLLGVVESLKVPNEVYAAQAGRVVALHAQDGQGVEWGQPLIEIEPEGV